jgi:hypothetical protein
MTPSPKAEDLIARPVATGMFAGDHLKTKCPLCRSKDFTTTEVFEELVHVQIRNGVHPGEAVDHEAGAILGISCICDRCGHYWTPRGAKSMDDLIVVRALQEQPTHD